MAAFLTGFAAFSQTANQLESLLNSQSSKSADKFSSTSAASSPKDGLNVLSKTSDRIMPSPIYAMSTNNYPVTAGDIYTLAFAVGNNSVDYKISVDTTYRIRVANLAVLNAAGMTFSELKRQVEDIVIKNYPMSGVQFILMTPAAFKVTLTGEVTSVQEKEAWALDRVHSIISEAMTDYSSIRNIEITDINGKTKTYDLFKAIRDGDMENDPYVRPGDKIKLNPLERKIELKGEVKRPGIYELIADDNIESVINYYGGGFTDFSNSSLIEIQRYDSEKREKICYYVSKEEFGSKSQICNYDTVVVDSRKDFSPVVIIEGAVTKDISGILTEEEKKVTTDNVTSSARHVINVQPKMKYSFLVKNYKQIYRPTSDLKNAYISRNEKHIPIDIERILYDSTYEYNEEIQDHDVLSIPSRQFFVTVSGAVRNPGRYPYSPNRDWNYYVGLAGGFSENNSFSYIRIVDSENKKHSKSDAIAPETTITAGYNSFLYNFNRIAPVITTTLTVITTYLAIKSTLEK